MLIIITIHYAGAVIDRRLCDQLEAAELNRLARTCGFTTTERVF